MRARVAVRVPFRDGKREVFRAGTSRLKAVNLETENESQNFCHEVDDYGRVHVRVRFLSHTKVPGAKAGPASILNCKSLIKKDKVFF